MIIHTLHIIILMMMMMGAECKRIDERIKRVPLRTHSLSQPYLEDNLLSRWYDYGGDTIIRNTEYVRLTNEVAGQAGYLFSRLPLTAADFEIEFEFYISGRGDGLHGDGMAMWLTSEKPKHTGSVFGSVDYFNGLGIFFDTYKNNRPGKGFPIIMPMIGDGKTSYNKDNDGKDQEAAPAFSAKGLINCPLKPARGVLTYIKNDFLSLDISFKADGVWKQVFIIDKIILPNILYLGFSAETGELTACHDIISIKVNSLLLDESTRFSSSSSKTKSKSSGRGGGFFSFIAWIIKSLFKLVFYVCILSALIYAGFFAYKKFYLQRQSSSSLQKGVFNL